MRSLLQNRCSDNLLHECLNCEKEGTRRLLCLLPDSRQDGRIGPLVPLGEVGDPVFPRLALPEVLPDLEQIVFDFDLAGLESGVHQSVEAAELDGRQGDGLSSERGNRWGLVLEVTSEGGLRVHRHDRLTLFT